MTTPRRTSVIVLITLAELAWLAAFALLFVYQSKVGELGSLRHQFDSVTNELAGVKQDLQAKAPDVAKMRRELDASRAESKILSEQLSMLQKALQGSSPEEAVRRVVAANKDATEKLDAASERLGELERALAERKQAETQVRSELAEAQAEAKKLQERLAALPANAVELSEQLHTARQQVAKLEEQLRGVQTENRQFTDTIRQREVGEFSVRRELTGLPDGNLRRVVFLVDTSTSMRNSPAWDSARKLIRTWIEFLPVEECGLVNFNDDAAGFPKTGYHRVRQPDGTKLPNQREELLRVFDQARPGTYTDLLRGLRRAYEYPNADVMVLFTDGHPHVSYQRDASLANDIFKEVAKHRGIPILTVALGSYEIEGAGSPQPRTNAPVSFLKALARQTGGSFLAR